MADAPHRIPHQEVMQASHSNDVGRVVSMYAEDAVLMPPNDTDLIGTDEIRSWWQDYFEFFEIVSNVETEREVTVAGDQAFERAAFSVVISSRKNGAEIRDDVRALTVWRRQPGGEWRISHQIWNSTKPVGSGTNRYMSRMLQNKSGS